MNSAPAGGGRNSLPKFSATPATRKIRATPRGFEESGQHRGGGGFAVGAVTQSNRGREEKMLWRASGQQRYGIFVIQEVFDFGVAARDGVADDHQNPAQAKDFPREAGVPAIPSFSSKVEAGG